ncbi:MAG: hypothetical protein LBT59_06505 [Clostridiales bacterium]|jgi:hypothetical protein|nr:hypothetical protein [Clostridiales bacterium]
MLKKCVAFALCAWLLTGCAASYAEPFDLVTHAIETGQGRVLLDTVPKYFMDAQKLIENSEQLLKTGQEEMDITYGLERAHLIDKYGENYRLTYRFLDKERLSEDDLEELVQYWDQEYGPFSEVKLQDGYELQVEMTLKGDEDKNIEIISAKVVKYQDKWYINPDDIEEMYW